MMKIFAHIRTFLALDRAARSIGEIASTVVRETIIPRLEKLAAEERDPREAERLFRLADEYGPYAKKGTAEYRDLEDTAEAAIVGEVAVFGLSKDNEDDVAQQVALDFYQPMTTGGRALLADLEKFPAEKSGKAFDYTKWFSRIVKMRAHTRLRDLARRSPDIFKKKDMVDEEGKNVLENMSGRGDSSGGLDDETALAEIRPQMDRYVLSRMGDEVGRALYTEFMKVTEKLGGGSVVLKRDVYPKLMSVYEGSRGVSEQALSEKANDMKKVIRSFFKDELHIRFTDRLNKWLKIGSVDRVAFGEFARRLALWVLGAQDSEEAV